MERLASDHQAQLHAHTSPRPTAIRTSTRTRVGWLLVGIGTRMVLGRGAVSPHPNVAGGR